MPLKTEKTQNSEKLRKSESVKAYVGETNLTESFTTVTQLLAEAEVEVAKGLQVDKDKAPRISIRIVIWILSSDTFFGDHQYFSYVTISYFQRMRRQAV